MSSSDSEEDCYGNVAKTLQNLKSKYKGDKLFSANLLQDSLEIKKNVTPCSDKDSTVVVVNSEPSNVNSTILDNTLTEDEELDRIIELNSRRVTRSSSSINTAVNNISTGKRKTRNSTRGSSKRKKDEANEDAVPPSDSIAASLLNVINSSAAPVPSPRGRNRGRRGRGRNNVRRGRNIPRNECMDFYYPTYSVGNTDEYPDQSDNIQLFSAVSKKPDVVLIEDTEDILDENEELSVKVYWQSSEIVKFSIRKYQKLVQLFEFFSTKANVNSDKLLFTYNDKILKPDDTPDSISYNIAKFIDGGTVNQSVSKLIELTSDKGIADGIKLKFQHPNSKKPFEITIQKDDLLSMAMIQCAEHMEMPLKSLRFEFDGDCITGKDTAKDLDMEGGECIDVKIIR